METAEDKTVEKTNEETKGSPEIDASLVRNHPLFAKLAKELNTYQKKIEKIEQDQAEKEKSMSVQREIEAGNFEAARKELENQKNSELQRIAAEKEMLAQELQMERASTKLIAAGATTEKVAAFIAKDYYAIPAEDRPDLTEWISKAKEAEEYAPFFSRPAGHLPAPADRTSSTAARSAGGESGKMKEILENPGKFSTPDVVAAVKWKRDFIAKNGRLP